MKKLLGIMSLLLAIGCMKEEVIRERAQHPDPAPFRVIVTPKGYIDMIAVDDTLRGVTCYIGQPNTLSCLKTFDVTTKVER